MRSYIENNCVFYILAILLLAFYVIGFTGLSDPLGQRYDEFLSLTPLNLVLTTALLLLFHQTWSLTFIASGLLVVLAGFFTEVLGVHTGLVFGEYAYGNTLGWKLFDVPLTIGLNWFLLVYIIAVVLDRLRHPLYFALAGAMVMTGLDVLIEPVAIRLDFWSWATGDVPLQNYIAWYLLSFVLFLFFRWVNRSLENKMAPVVLAIQFLFFTALNFCA